MEKFMSESNLLKTEEICLDVKPDDNVIQSSNVKVTRFSDEFATDSSMPSEENELSDNTSNPIPVSGYAEEVENESITFDSNISIERQDDGRFTFEVIIGPDNRVRVTNPNPYPWRVHGHIEMQFPNGKRYIGSGTMINNHHVLTAGHVVYSRKDGGWATSMTFQAARNNNSLPFGTVSATRLLSVKGWTDNNNTKYDMGMMILANDLGNRTGWMGVISGPDRILTRYRVNVTGYPGDKGGTQMWTMADIIKAVQTERVFYDIDTMGGQSGSGVWSTWSGHQGEKVCAIHTTGSTSGNGATRISRPKFDRIVDWISRY
jgi:V8-like Glu-specific endopeptidase